MTSLTLHQFLYSHYNEKVRWALAYKGIPHRRQTYLPGPHARAIRKLSGQTQTPVCESDNTVVAGSAAIIEHLEVVAPKPALYPQDPVLKSEALQWQQRADETLGPATRTVLFAELIEEPDYLCGIFSAEAGSFKRTLYRRIFPLAKALMAKGNGLSTKDKIVRATEVATNFMDEIAATTEDRPYLVGDQFSVADLTCAALIAPLCTPLCDDMTRPTPIPPRIQAFVQRWSRHQACVWTEDIFTKHRPPAATLIEMAA